MPIDRWVVRGGGGSIDIGISLSVDCWFMQSIDFDVERGGLVRMLICEFLVGVKNGHDGITTRKSSEIVFPKEIVKRKI